MSLASSLPHVGAALNVALTAVLVLAFIAIRRGREQLHRTRMLQALGLGVAFLVVYLLQNALLGHRRFPGDDWLKSVFMFILISHTIMAIALVPLVIMTVRRGLKGKREAHRKIARFTLATWLYVAVTAILLYMANNYVRPPV